MLIYFHYMYFKYILRNYNDRKALFVGQTLLTITSTLHARSISLAFVLFKVGLPSPNWNCLNDLGIYSRHVLQAGTLAGYDCHISGNKKAQSLDRALKLVNIWVAALKFKPLRLKLSRHWVP